MAHYHDKRDGKYSRFATFDKRNYSYCSFASLLVRITFIFSSGTCLYNRLKLQGPVLLPISTNIMILAKSDGYLTGFNNEFESEAKGYEGALPRDKINPQRCPLNLKAEQLSGSAFTAPRATNRRSWLYRKTPSVVHRPYQLLESKQLDYESGQSDPNQRRWKPFDPPDAVARGSPLDFVQGLNLLAFSESSLSGGGPLNLSVGILVYHATSHMLDKSFVNADGDFLIVPQEGTLIVTTEFGVLRVEPNEIVVIQQGMKFSIDLDLVNPLEDIARGYILEVTGNHFVLPDLGPIGANGLANPRDFLIPRAQMQSRRLPSSYEIIMKFQGKLFKCKQDESPYDVAAWFGNYVPFKYDLSKFVSVNSVSVDHPDPSIFTVLTCPSGKPGTALADFVIFPPRWECARDTFRPPYYHRNCMTEFMGLIKGKYQAKSSAFAPGGASLHQAMIPHGPDTECFEFASEQDTSKPTRVADETMAFMFETSLTLKLTRWARECNVDEDYHKCWSPLTSETLGNSNDYWNPKFEYSSEWGVLP